MKTKNKIFFFVCSFFLILPSFLLANSSVPFTFTLSNSAKTSAGVYTHDSVLVRTLWSNVTYAAGTHAKVWDGNDDEGMPVAANTYLIKVLSNNVVYTWEGVIGNTSTAITGSAVHRNLYKCMNSMAITNGTAFFSGGYGERVPSSAKFLLSNPQAKIRLGLYPVSIPYSQGQSTMTQSTDFVVTDGTNNYWGGFDAYSTNNAFVFVTKVSNDTEVILPNSSPYAVTYGVTYQSAINKENNASSKITGLAVQKTGSYLFVAHAAMNELHVLNKSTGALLHRLNIILPSALCVDRNDNLWMVSNNTTVAKYTVNVNGTLSVASLLVAGLQSPLALQVSPDNSRLLVADGGGSQQVKAFNNTTGAPLWTFGSYGGYSRGASVSNRKFYFSDVRGKLQTFIAFEPDNSFWVGDPGNFRVQHYTTDTIFINNIMSLGTSHFPWVDKNNTSRLFTDYLEFSIDYTKPLGSCWRLINNWGAKIPSTYDQFQKFKYPTTLSNNRIYALMRNYNGLQVVELQASGLLRFTGKSFSNLGTVICKDGSLEVSGATAIGQSSVISKYPLTGFDFFGNPVWATTPITLATVASVTINDPIPSEGLRNETVTTSNKVVFYNYNKIYSHNPTNVYYTGYHLGAMQKGTNKWLWRTEKATTIGYEGTFPGAGYFDIGNGGNQYAGSNVNVLGKHIITGYHGEFWKQSQTNKYNHYWDNGLAIGQFGSTGPEATEEAAAKMAGNALTASLVQGLNGEMYLWHGDESYHAGIHRWKITGLNTIAEQVISVIYPSNYTPPTPCYVDLMAGLKFDTVLVNGNGWERSEVNEQVSNLPWVDYWSVKTNVLAYDRNASPDVFVAHTKSSTVPYTVTRDLGINNVTNRWKITGEIAYTVFPNNVDIKRNIEILDDLGRVIASFYPKVNVNTNPWTLTLFGNNQIVVQNSATTVGNMISQLRSFEVEVVNGIVTFKYANNPPVNATVFDVNANWRTPKKLRLYFEGRPWVYGSTIGVKDMRFYKDITNTESCDRLGSPQLLSFKTKINSENKVALEWETVGENQLSDYIVQKSNDGFNFKTIGSGKTTSKSENQRIGYNFIDEKPSSGINYYRLELKGIKTSIQFSEITSIDASIAQKGKIFPNPFSKELTIDMDYTQNKKREVIIQMFDALGRQVLIEKTFVEGKKLFFRLKTGTLPPGNYLIRITNGDESWQEKVTKI